MNNWFAQNAPGIQLLQFAGSVAFSILVIWLVMRIWKS
jgi:hypothetical protein